MAFFPCIYFSCLSQMAMTWGCKNYKRLTIKQKSDAILDRVRNREYFLGLAIKMLTIAKERGLRLIMENPYSMQGYLKNSFIIPPTLIDKNRMLRGDYFVKPTAYWFINCKPTNGFTLQNDKKRKKINDCKPSAKAGVCSEERSMISPDYARNFICDFILGREQINTIPSLFSPE